jgi:hypothetical protein
MNVTRVHSGSIRTVDVIQLAYAGGRELVPPLVRIGGVVGFVGLLLSFLLAPVLCNPAHDEGYGRLVHQVVPAGQFFLAGGALALTIAGHRLSGRRASFGLMLVLAINLATIAAGVAELLRVDTLSPGWRYLSCPH